MKRFRLLSAVRLREPDNHRMSFLRGLVIVDDPKCPVVLWNHGDRESGLFVTECCPKRLKRCKLGD